MRKFIILTLLVGFVAHAAEPPAGQSHEKKIKSQQQVAKSLGWVVTPQNCYICGGYYREPLLDFANYGLIKEQDTHITASSGSIFRTGRSTLRGHVVVEQPAKRSESDLAYVYRDAKTGRVSQVDLLGHVRIREPGRLLLGEKAHFDLTKDSGTIDQATYRLARDDQQTERYGLRELYGVNGWGKARKMVKVRKGYYIFHEATYATCPPTKDQWQLSAKKLIIDDVGNSGKAYHAVFRIHDVPVMYLPYYSFALRNIRKSGLLMGVAWYTSKSGFDYNLPYYWNIAPNYDATFTPHVYSKRGLMVGGEFRYLNERTDGQLSGTFLPHDKKFKKFRRQINEQRNINIKSLGKNNRASFHWLHHMVINPHWSNDINFNYVSDDYYFQDFTSAIESTLQTQLVRQFDLNYHGSHWSFLGRLQDYQTLRPIDDDGVADVYSRLPQLLVNGYYPHINAYTDFNIKAETVYFRWPNKEKASGGRLLIDPALIWPLKTRYAYLTPRLELHSRFYQLRNQGLGLPDQVTRVLPIFSVDSGLFYERHLTLFEHAYQQTLEPRLYYLLVPFKRQTQLPLFDSGLYSFTYNQLFRNNRFSGDDRIGDANQLSFALTSRLLDGASAHEKFTASIGAILYFADRKVAFCSDNEKICSKPQNVVRYTSPVASVSPVVGLAKYHFNDHWSVNTDIAVDFHGHGTDINNGHVGFRYQDSHNRIVDFHYGFERALLTSQVDPQGKTFFTQDKLHQVGIASSMPLTKNWSFLGAFSYNIEFDHLQATFAGLQYEGCCWALRVLGLRTLTSRDQQNKTSYNNGFYIQLQLKGLGIFGQNEASQVLTSAIPGFYDFLAQR